MVQAVAQGSYLAQILRRAQILPLKSGQAPVTSRARSEAFARLSSLATDTGLELTPAAAIGSLSRRFKLHDLITAPPRSNGVHHAEHSPADHDDTLHPDAPFSGGVTELSVVRAPVKRARVTRQ